MVNLSVQKRLAASILKCGKRKVFLDPSEQADIALATSRAAIRKLVKATTIYKKKNVVHSRSRKARRDEAVSKGRHTGFGKRRGTANARLPSKVIWIRRLRVLRRLLAKYRKAKKIDKHLYHELYLQCKGARYKSKRVLMEEIHKRKAEKKRLQDIDDQAVTAKSRAAKKIANKKDNKNKVRPGAHFGAERAHARSCGGGPDGGSSPPRPLPPAPFNRRRSRSGLLDY